MAERRRDGDDAQTEAAVSEAVGAVVDARAAESTTPVAPPTPALDETVPGGRYRDGDRLVDANGKEIKD